MMDLQFLNELKKENKELRREQNKRYCEKNREILNLKSNVYTIKKILKNVHKSKFLDVFYYLKQK